VKVTGARKQPAPMAVGCRSRIDARKLYADGEGRENEAALEEPFDVGIFTAEPGKKDFTTAAVLLFERKPIRSGRQTLNLVTASEPTFAGVDPYNKRVDRNSEDNLRAIDQAP
jgi:hypothetical protein